MIACKAREADLRQIQLKLFSGDAPLDPTDADRLRVDLADDVGPTSFAEGPAVEGAKGTLSVDFATLVVSLLGTPAVVALVNVLKSYFDSDRVTEIELSGPRGSVKLKLPSGNRLSADDIRRALDSVLGPGG